MYVIEKSKTHFLNLFENRNSASKYFDDNKLDEINGKRLEELQENLKNEKAMNKETMIENSDIRFSNMESAYQLSRAINDLDIFESNLAFLIIMGYISAEQTEKLGFSDEYIAALLDRYEKQIKKPYTEYYYDKRTENTAKMTENGTMRILHYIPHTVKKANEKSHPKKYNY